MPVEAVIFDMDGVLIDSEVYWEQCRVAFAQALGKPWHAVDQRACMGRSTHEWAAVMQQRLELDWPPEAIIEDMFARVKARLDDHLPIRPGALAAVHLAAAHYPTALASGSPIPIIQHVMALTGLDKVFDAMVYGDDQPNGKPAPDIYLAAARALGVAPQVCIGIEDSPNGIYALHNAGMYIIAAPSPDFPLASDVLALAHAHITTMEDFSLPLITQASA